MLRIFVTGDNHIGSKYANHSAKEILVKTRIDAFSAMVDQANGEGCALFVITGDLFHNNYSISKKDVKAVFDQLAEFRGTVAYLPGNHDFYDPEAALWKTIEELMPNYDNIMILSEFRPYPISEGAVDFVLYPALCTKKHSLPEENNLGWIKKESIARDGAYHVGIAHGAVEGETIDNEGVYFPMKRAELESIPVDAWLIGHTHVPFPRNLTEEYAPTEKIFNAGTHVQTDVNCNTEGQCFLLEISPDRRVRGKKYNPSSLRFYRKEVTVSPGELKNSIDRALSGIGPNSVVELLLKGPVTEEEYGEKERIAEKCLAPFLEGKANCSDVSRLITAELIDREYAETSIHARFLKALLSDPKEAHMAYEFLTELKEEQ